MSSDPPNTRIHRAYSPSRASHYKEGAILASVFAGLGTTLLRVAFGSAAGIEAADDGGDETRISSIVGTWTVISALLGTLVGTFIGGRYSRYQSGASAV